MGRTTEDLCISKINAGIRAIKFGTKKPEETKIGYFLKKLGPLNPGMFHELQSKYIKVYKEWKNKELEKSYKQ